MVNGPGETAESVVGVVAADAVVVGWLDVVVVSAAPLPVGAFELELVDEDVVVVGAVPLVVVGPLVVVVLPIVVVVVVVVVVVEVVVDVVVVEGGGTTLFSFSRVG